MRRERDIDEVRARALHKLRTRGLEACIDGLIAVAEDDKSPANARATASSSLARANGLYEPSNADAAKELHEMTASELKLLSEQLERDRQQVIRELEGETDNDIAFD